MTKINDGGPAAGAWAYEADGKAVHYPGMSLRDYFAIHADQPGAAEIATAAGLTFSSGAVWSDGDSRIASFEDWWRGLSQDRRFELSATVRYQQADAMLAVRSPARSA
jgi:hypothetical protein